MCHTMKSIELIRLNQHCNRVSIDDMMYFWKNDRYIYKYKNFERETYKFIEKEIPEVIFLLIKNTKDFIYYYIKKELELNISDTDNIDDYIYFEDKNLYKVSYFFAIRDKTGILSNEYMRVTNYIEVLPSCWIDKCVMELCSISFDKYKESSKIYFKESKNRIIKTYNYDLIENEFIYKI
jgi:hypothetical protein